MTSRNVLVLGAASWNRMVHVDTLPQGREATVFAARETEAAGSTGVGKAMVAASLGHRVTLHCALGRDAEAEKIIATCEARGISMMVDWQDAPTPRHLNIMDKAGGRYSLFLSNGADTPSITPERLRSAIKTADVFFLSLCNSSLAALSLLKEATAPIYLDLHDYDGANPWYLPFIETADVIQLSDVALNDPAPVVATLLAGRARQIILTRGRHGAEIFTADTHSVVPATPARLVDSNGAGDAFSVGEWHATAAGLKQQEAGDYAAAIAAIAIQTTDLFPKHPTLPGLPPHD